MYKISKEFTFSASHQLFGLPEGHPCARNHGHNYVIKVELESNALNSTGMVLDYRRLDILKSWIDETFDHRNLNDVLQTVTTAENLAKYICDFLILDLELSFVSAVEVSETPKTNCRYEPTNN